MPPLRPCSNAANVQSCREITQLLCPSQLLCRLSLVNLVQVFVLHLALCCCVTAKRAPRIAVLSMSTGVTAKPYIAQTVVNKAMCAATPTCIAL